MLSQGVLFAGNNMATALVTASVWRHVLLSVVIFLGQCQPILGYAPRIDVTCKTTVDLQANNYDAGLIVSRLPERIPIYANQDERCDIFLSIPTGYRMMIYFDWLDLYSGDLTQCDNTNIEVFDGSPGKYVTGLINLVCGREEDMPTGAYFLDQQFLVIRVNAKGVIQGSGFRIHFTIARISFPCSRDEFACQTYGVPRCIADHLVCDDWNDCGDWVDEQQHCNNITGGGIAAVVIAAILFVAIVIGLIIFCKIRRQSELSRMKEKETVMKRDLSSFSNRGGLMSPYSVSSETMEKEKYLPRYATGRNSGRRSQTPTKAPDYNEKPPPYSENLHSSCDDSRSEEDKYNEQDPPRSRRKSRNRQSIPDDVFEEEDVPKVRREKVRSHGANELPNQREDCYPSRRDDLQLTPDDRHSKDKTDSHSSRDERYSSRDQRYPSRDERYQPRDERHPPRDERYPSRSPDSLENDCHKDNRNLPRLYDDQDIDSDSRHSRGSERGRGRYRDDRDREKNYQREQPPSHRGEPGDSPSSGPEDLDQLHPMREQKRCSLYNESDRDSSSRDRSREDLFPPRDDRDDRHEKPKEGDHYSPRGKDDRNLPRARDDQLPLRDKKSPSARDKRPASGTDHQNRVSESQGGHPHAKPGHSSKEIQSLDHSSDGRDSPPLPPPPPELMNPDLASVEEPSKRRRRRSRSREGQDKSRNNRPGSEGRTEGIDQGEKRGRSSGAPLAEVNQPRRSRHSRGGYKEESV